MLHRTPTISISDYRDGETEEMYTNMMCKTLIDGIEWKRQCSATTTTNVHQKMHKRNEGNDKLWT